MAKKNLPYTLDVKMNAWNEIFSRNELLQKKLEQLREECATDPDWNPVDGSSVRFKATRDLLLKEVYDFEKPFPFPVLEITDNQPEIIFRSDGTACGMKQHDPPPIRTLKVDLRYTREEILYRFKGWLYANWDDHHDTRLPEKQQVAKWERYLQVYDLHNKDRSLRSVAATLNPSITSDKDQWDREEYAVTKQYRRAIELIYGNDAPKILKKQPNQQIAGIGSEDSPCNSCKHRPTCQQPCPQLIVLIPSELKVKELLVSKPSTLNLEHFKKRSSYKMPSE